MTVNFSNNKFGFTQHQKIGFTPTSSRKIILDLRLRLKQLGHGAGFTLIEILIVMIILVVLLSTVLSNFRLGERVDEYRSSVQFVASEIRKAQNSALVGLADSDSLGNSYGIYFDTTSSTTQTKYLFFEDNDHNSKYSSGTDRVVETINLPPEVMVGRIFIGPTNDVSNVSTTLNLLFSPPKPTDYVNTIANEKRLISLIFCRQSLSGKLGLVTFNPITSQVSSGLQDSATCP